MVEGDRNNLKWCSSQLTDGSARGLCRANRHDHSYHHQAPQVCPLPLTGFHPNHPNVLSKSFTFSVASHVNPGSCLPK